MGLNQKALIQQIMAASDVDFGAKSNNPATLPWGPLIAAYLGLTEDYPDEVASPARMLGHVLGPMQSVVAKEQNPTPFLLTLGMISGGSVQINQISVTFEEALSRTREPLKLIHPDWGENELRQFQQKVRVEARSLIAVNGERPVTFDIRQIDLTPLEDFMAETSSPSRTISLTGREKLEFSAGIVGVALSGVTMWDFFKRTDNILEAGLRSQGRLLGMGLALTSGAAELVGKTLEHGRGVLFAEARFVGTQRALLVAGRFLGLAGGLILGVMDLWEGRERLEDGEQTLGYLYIASGTFTIGASTFVFLASIGTAAAVAGSTTTLAALAVAFWWTGVTLGIIAIAAAVGIWWETEDDLQEWLAQCAFGGRGQLDIDNPDMALKSEMQRLDAISHKERQDADHS